MVDISLSAQEKAALQSLPKIKISEHSFKNQRDLNNCLSKYGSIKRSHFGPSYCFVHFWCYDSAILAIKFIPLEFKNVQTGKLPVVSIANDAFLSLEKPIEEYIPLASSSFPPALFQPPTQSLPSAQFLPTQFLQPTSTPARSPTPESLRPTQFLQPTPTPTPTPARSLTTESLPLALSLPLARSPPTPTRFLQPTQSPPSTQNLEYSPLNVSNCQLLFNTYDYGYSPLLTAITNPLPECSLKINFATKTVELEYDSTDMTVKFTDKRNSMKKQY